MGVLLSLARESIEEIQFLWKSMSLSWYRSFSFLIAKSHFVYAIDGIESQIEMFHADREDQVSGVWWNGRSFHAASL